MPPNVLTQAQSRSKGPLKRSVSCVEPPSLEALNAKKNSQTRRHSKIEIVSCFRSSGSVPVPRPLGDPSPPRPPKPTLSILRASTETLSEEFEQVPAVVDYAPIPEEISSEFRIAEDADPSDVCRISEEPLIKTLDPPKRNNCEIHSKCHCDLFSKDLDNFFAIEIKQQ